MRIPSLYCCIPKPDYNKIEDRSHHPPYISNPKFRIFLPLISGNIYYLLITRIHSFSFFKNKISASSIHILLFSTVVGLQLKIQSYFCVSLIQHVFKKLLLDLCTAALLLRQMTAHLKSLVCCVSPSEKRGHAESGVYLGEDEVSFDDFQILRAIGKGTFGKVCIVQKRDTKKMYAMKYMSKQRCFKHSYLANVVKEIDILKRLEHPFLVNLWYAFEVEEDIFMVVDLLMGGDLRYHIQNNVDFEEPLVKLYLCELSLALDYLHKNRIIHRDVKPDNIMLDEQGHVHLGDFNIATFVKDFCDVRSLSGTKPYMAPEIFACALSKVSGYGFPVDWWSLGICAYEMLYKKRPYEITSDMTVQQVYETIHTNEVVYFSYTKIGMINLMKGLLTLNPAERIKNFKMFKEQPYVNHMNFQAIYNKKTKPSFLPSQEQLNCDPTFELEEMIIEAKPLHKKKKRLAKNLKRELIDKRLSKTSNDSKVDSVYQDELERVLESFKPFNREKHLKEKARREIKILPDKLTPCPK